MASQSFRVKNSLEVGTGVTITSGGNITAGVVTATSFVGSGSQLTQIVVSTVVGGAISATSLSVTGVSTFDGAVKIRNGYNLNIGDNNDLRIYNDGENSRIQETGSGTFYISGSDINIQQDSTNKNFARFVGGGAAELYYNDSKKFETSGIGITVTGTINSNQINVSGVVTASSFSGNASSATYATSAGIATYSTSSGIATYSTSSGIATYATSAGIASTATAAGTAYGLTGSPNITVGNVTGSAATFSNNLNVGTAITMYSSTGIISATKYYGDGSGLSGIDATRIVSGLSSVTVATSSTISAYVNGSNIFNVTGTGVTMTSGKRLDVSSYSENVNFLGSVSGSTALDVGTYSVFVADISGSTSVTFTLSGAVSGRLSSATLILIFSGSASRSVSLAFNPKYVGGGGPTYSTTAVTDIISFFTANAGTTTYVSVVGQGFA